MEKPSLIPYTELKTIYIDIENKVYMINGKSFEKGCETFSFVANGKTGTLDVQIVFFTERLRALYNLRGKLINGLTYLLNNN